jgi:two-component system, sensor histidine kinase LadS
MRWRLWTSSVWLVVFLALAALPALSQATLELDPARTYSLFDAAQVQRDGGPLMQPGAFAPDGRASVFRRPVIDFHLSLKGDPSVPWVIRFGQQIDSVDLIEPDGTVVHNGMAVPFDRRPLANVRPTLAVPSQLLDGTPFQVRMQTTTEVRAPRLMTEIAARTEDDGTRTVVFLFVGFYFAVALVFGLLYLNLRDKQLLLYALVMLTLVAFEAINKAYAWEYLWPGASVEWHLPNALAFWAYYAALVAFCAAYLHASGKTAWFKVAAVVLLALNLPAAIAGADIHDFPGVLPAAELLTAALLLDLLLWAIFAWRAGQRSARFYVIAFAGVFAGVIVNRLALDQILPHTGFTEWILEIGTAWEAVLLALAVASSLSDTIAENALLHASEQQLTKLATIDGLTGVGNRRTFDARLDAEWNRLCRSARPLALLFVDVDYFKQYNDTYGHLAGDDALRRIARALQAFAARPSDLCARYGGEEFAVLLAEVALPEAAELAERMRVAVAALAIAHALSPVDRVTISVGVASLVPTMEASPDALVASADGALYEAKRSGRNAVVIA